MRHLNTLWHDLAQTIEFNLFGNVLCFDVGVLCCNENQIPLILPAVFLDPVVQCWIWKHTNIKMLIISNNRRISIKKNYFHSVLPSISPNRRIKYSRAIVWNVMPMTWHTYLRIESKNPFTLTTKSGVDKIFDQNNSKSHFSKISAKMMISLIVSSSICCGSNKHLHNTKSVCGKLVSAFNKIKLVTSKFSKCGLNW